MHEQNSRSEHREQQMRQAAEYRANGMSFEAIASKMNRSVYTIRSWITSYPELWKKLLLEARQSVAAEAADEAVHVLRNQLRTDDEKIKLDAAKKLIDHHEDDQPVKPTAKEQTSPLTQFLIHLEGLSDEELQQMLTSFREPARTAGSDVPSTPPESASEA